MLFGASGLHQRADMGRNGARKIVRRIAAFEQGDDAASAAPRGDLHDAKRRVAKIAVDKAQSAERIVDMGVEPCA